MRSSFAETLAQLDLTQYRIVSYRIIRPRLSPETPLCPLLYDFSISLLRKLFITNTVAYRKITACTPYIHK